MFTDEHRRSIWDDIRQRDLHAFAKYLTPQLLRQAATDAQVAWGQGPLHLGTLTWLGLSSALHRLLDFASILSRVLKILSDNPAWQQDPLAKAQRDGQRKAKRRKGRRKKHDPRRDDPTAVSEEAFTQARQKMPPPYWAALLVLLGQRFEQEHDALVRWKQFRLLTLDGTCVTLDHWKKLSDHFGTAKNGKSKGTPQARLVMLQLPLVRLPWRYELVPLAEGERTVATRLLASVRPQDLVLMDRGFWSYGLFWQLQWQGASFAIRRFKSAGLKKVRSLGPGDQVVSWTPSDRQWHQGDFPKGIRLRLIDYQIKGFRPSQVVTNVLDRHQVARDEWVRLTTDSEPGRLLDPGLYHRRWEIETSYAELKVQQGMQESLRSRTPEGIAFEVAGHVLLYLLLRWLMVDAAVTQGVDPLRLSFQGAYRELLQLQQTLLTSPLSHVRRVLLPRLLARLVAHPVPLRPGRHYPRPHDLKIRRKGKGKISLPSKLGPVPCQT